VSGQSEWKKRNRPAMSAYRRKWMKEHPKKRHEYEENYRKKHGVRLKRESREKSRKFRRDNPNYEKNLWRRIRLEVLKKYGGKCKCCGTNVFEFLSFDHIKGRGKKHRDQLLATGRKLLVWLRKNKRKKSIQILCHNCNQSLGHYGYCPHRPNVKRKVIR
jgi:hypothetical protein